MCWVGAEEKGRVGNGAAESIYLHFCHLPVFITLWSTDEESCQSNPRSAHFHFPSLQILGFWNLHPFCSNKGRFPPAVDKPKTLWSNFTHLCFHQTIKTAGVSAIQDKWLVRAIQCLSQSVACSLFLSPFPLSPPPHLSLSACPYIAEALKNLDGSIPGFTKGSG